MMMCERCESPQFLQIVRSRVNFSGMKLEELSEFSERYQCTQCGAHGQLYRSSDGEVQVTGDVYQTAEVTV